MIYFDCYQGAAGDMLVGALLDIRGDNGQIKAVIKKLKLKNVEFEITKSARHSISGISLNLKIISLSRCDKLSKVEKIISDSSLSKKIKKNVLKTYRIIFKAEAAVHSVDIEKVHLHELGSVDTLIEIASYWTLLENEEVYCSVLPLGCGVQKSAHGLIPIPSPAAIEILKGIPVKFIQSEKEGELVTPTAAALLKASIKFNLNEIIIKKIGYGIGKRSILRAVSGSKIVENNFSDILQLEFNIDDMTSEDITALTKKILKIVKDVFVTSVIMKKGRTGYLITVICKRKKFSEVKNTIFNESTTTGFRYWIINREELPRKIIKFKSSFGHCKIKEVKLPSGALRSKPEFNDLMKISKKTGINTFILRSQICKEFNDE